MNIILHIPSYAHQIIELYAAGRKSVDINV